MEEVDHNGLVAVFDVILIGLVIRAFGFAIEVTAAAQDSGFRADLKYKWLFIHTGPWAWSRHPNYFGEIVLWIDVAVTALPVLGGW